FSGNTAAQGGTDLYVLSDKSDGGNNTSPGSGTASAVLVDDILGQADSSVPDFASATNGTGASAPTFTGSSNDLVRSGGAALGSAVVSTGDPLLAPLAPHGGPTETMAITQASSPAVGAGVAVTGISTDQRGVSRQSPPDLGAFDDHLTYYQVT